MAKAKSTGGAGTPKSTPTPTPTKAIVQAAQRQAQKASIKQGNANIATSYQAQANKIGANKPITGKKTGKNTVVTNTASVPLTVILPGPVPGPGGSDYTPYEFAPTSIKIPDKDAVIALQRDGADQALITAVLFEQIGATELVKFTRNDTIDGINPAYSVISNIADLKTKLDVSYLIAKQRSDTTIDNGFSIRLQDKLPSIDYLFENDIPNYVYFDATINSEGSLVIELDNIDIDEIIEVEIDTNGTIVEVRQ
jgi:hypothetical protein